MRSQLFILGHYAHHCSSLCFPFLLEGKTINSISKCYDYARFFFDWMGAFDGDRNSIYEFRSHAEQGNTTAQNILGKMYENGDAVPKDYKEAVKWYKKGSDQGDAPAQYNLARMYCWGVGVSHDNEEAAGLLQKSAEQGYAWSQKRMGELCDKGQGVPKDVVQAYKWYDIAGNNSDRFIRTTAIIRKNALAKQMTQSQMQEANHFAQEWMELYQNRKKNSPKVIIP